jgi:hypothetical protein
MSTLFYIASLKHTGRDDEHITWWGPDHRGYTPVFGDRIGVYTLAEAQRLNDGFDCLAVPVDAVRELLSPEPYFRAPSAFGPGRFYDQRGPVVENSRANWNRLIAAGLEGRVYVPKPEVYRRKRRAFALEHFGSPAC